VLAGGADPAAAADGSARDDAAEEDVADLTSHAHLQRLAEHPDRDRRLALAALLPDVLAWMTPLERVELIASWASSTSPQLRLAIARALRHAPPVPGSIVAIEHLAGDPDPAVRAAIAEAAWLRRRESPDDLIAVLHRLAEDDNLFVQEVARLALGDT
jgi:HEAT repeat protein